MKERPEQQPRLADESSPPGYGSINDHISLHNRDDIDRAGQRSPAKVYRPNVSLALATFGLALLIIAIVVTILYNPSLLPSSSSSSTTSSSSSSTTSISMVAIESSSLSTTTTGSGSDSSDNNRIVDLLQRSSTILHPQSYYKSKIDEFPSMYIDLEHERQVYNGHTTTERSIMTISWTDGRFRDSHDSILSDNTNDKNIVALQCGDSDSRLHIVDAKTLNDAASTSSSTDNNVRHRQLRTRSTDTVDTADTVIGTHRMLKWYDYYGFKDIDWWGGSGTLRDKAWRSNSNNDYKDSDNSKWHTTEHYESSSYNSEHNYYGGGNGSNEWYIGSVPNYILNQRKCQAIIFYHIRDDEYVVVGKSTILHL